MVGDDMKINLDNNVKNVDIGLLDRSGPDDELIGQVLVALHHIGKQSTDPSGFWIRAGQIVAWLKANNYPTDSLAVGHTLSKQLKLKITKKMADGIFHWINREDLQKKIDAFNGGETDASAVKGSGYEKIKRDVFEAILNEEDPTELEYDEEAIAKASKEFIEMGEEDAQKWLEGDE